MAQIIPGKSKCILCRKEIGTVNEAVAFPAFVPPGHIFHRFSDGIFHRTCFAKWEDHEAFQQLYDDYERVWKSRPANLSFQEIEAWGQQAFEKVFREGMRNSE